MKIEEMNEFREMIKSMDSGKLQELLENIGDDTLDNDDLLSFLLWYGTIVKLYLKQNAKYKDCWKETGLGAKGMFAEINAKYKRLKTLVWDTPEDQWDVPKIVETFRDLILYGFFAIRLIEIDHKIDMVKVEGEADKT